MTCDQSGLPLIHAVLVDVSKRWYGVPLTPEDLEKLNTLRSELVPLAAADQKGCIGVTPAWSLQTT
jgi:hypothetical protein